MLGLHDALGKFAVGDAANTIPGVVAVHDTGQVSSSRANFAYIMDQPCQRAAEQVKPDDKTTGLHYSCASLLGLELMKLPIAAILTQAALTLWRRPGHEELKALCKWLGTPFRNHHRTDLAAGPGADGQQPVADPCLAACQLRTLRSAKTRCSRLTNRKQVARNVRPATGVLATPTERHSCGGMGEWLKPTVC